jgi:hypothetical protein
MIALLLRLMVYFIHLMDTAPIIYGKSIIGYWPTVVYSLLPLVAGAIYDSVVVLLNDFECHPTPVSPALPSSSSSLPPSLTGSGRGGVLFDYETIRFPICESLLRPHLLRFLSSRLASP